MPFISREELHDAAAVLLITAAMLTVFALAIYITTPGCLEDTLILPAGPTVTIIPASC